MTGDLNDFLNLLVQVDKQERAVKQSRIRKTGKRRRSKKKDKPDETSNWRTCRNPNCEFTKKWKEPIRWGVLEVENTHVVQYWEESIVDGYDAIDIYEWSYHYNRTSEFSDLFCPYCGTLGEMLLREDVPTEDQIEAFTQATAEWHSKRRMRKTPKTFERPKMFTEPNRNLKRCKELKVKYIWSIHQRRISLPRLEEAGYPEPKECPGHHICPMRGASCRKGVCNWALRKCGKKYSTQRSRVEDSGNVSTKDMKVAENFLDIMKME